MEISEENKPKHYASTHPIDYACHNPMCNGKNNDLVCIADNHKTTNNTDEWLESFKCKLCGYIFTI